MLPLRLLFLAAWLLLPRYLSGQDKPLWVAVGAEGRRVASADGVHWKNDFRWRDGLLQAVAYGGGRFVAVGHTGGRPCACATADGEHWTEWPEQRELAALAFGRGKFVALGGGELFISDGASPFTPGAPLPWTGEIHPLQIACGDTEAGFRFVAIGEADLSANGARVFWRGVTEDGTRWEHAVSGTPPARALAYGAGIFVAVGAGGLVETSHDGQAWDRRDSGTAEDFSALVWDGARFLAQGTHLWSSPDGIAWQKAGAPPPKLLLWASRDAALGVTWEGQLVRSTDLAHWRACEMPAGPALTAIAFRPPLSAP